MYLTVNIAIAGSTISGKVTCKRVKDPRDTIVYVEKVEGKFEPPEEHAIMNQQNILFVPHVLPVLVGTSVKFRNNDTVHHNVFSPIYAVKVFNLGITGAGSEKSILFDVIGEIPVLCNIHAEMSGYIVSL